MFKLIERKNNVVKIVDSMMGTSKSTNILKWMNDNPNKNYIFVSPLLSEVDNGGRVHQELSNVTLEVPNDEVTTKSKSLLYMLERGDSIACTHSLYLSMTDAHFYQMSINDYTVIIDEEVNVIGGFDKYSKSDLQWLLENNNIEISPVDGMVSWVGNREKIEPSHKYFEFIKYCDSKSLYCTKRSDTMTVTQLPIKLFECAKEVIILTYMFKGNVLDCFLSLKGFEVQPFTEIKTEKVDKNKIRDLLNIIPPNNKIVDYQQSSTWWSEANAKQINDIANFIKTNSLSLGLKGEDVCWTAPKSRSVKVGGQKKNLIKPKGYIQDKEGNPCYLAAQTRATNIYDHKKAMFHCYNRRPLVPVSAYLQDYGHPVDLQVFATSELLQWAWRGCIRKGEPMTLAIGSKRMYNFFMQWLNDEEQGGAS